MQAAAEAEPRFVFLGYFPKLVLPRQDEWWVADNVAEICSVGDCISESPKAWMDLWKHNDCFFYDEEATARAVASIDGRKFDVFGYAALPRRFDVDGEHAVDLPKVSPAPMSADYRMIGYDMVECTQRLETGAPVECSPLSCNGMSREIAVNRYCLVDDFGSAMEAARLFGSGRTGVEPGPYYLFQVWRRAT